MKGNGLGRGERLAPREDGGRRGVTLVELIVALALLGLILGICTLAIASLRPASGSEILRALAQARAEAIRTGRMVRTVMYHSPLPAVLFLPDGSAIGPGVDPLTGAIRASR